MSINFIKQDLTTSNAQYICHQVNCQGAMNSGVAKAIREKWPIVFTTYWNTFLNESNLLGTILTVDLNDYEPKTWPQAPIIVNMFSQEHYGYDGKRYTSYDAFWSCLGHIRESIPKGSKIAFPYKIGCDRGGANWEVIYTMIVAALGYDYKIEICYLQEDDWLKFHLDLGWEDK
jgi:O-acetyl-ADP-ribose deacetylase (regulator of RNase III)